MKKSAILIFSVLAFLLAVALSILVKAQENANINTGTSITLGANDSDLEEQETNETQETDAAEQELEQEDVILPNERGYKWGRFKEKLKLASIWNKEEKIRYELILLQRRLAELRALAQLNVTKYNDVLSRQYNKTLEELEKRIDKLEEKGKNVTELRERLQNMTYKHVLVLQRVLAKAPGAARAGLNNAILASQNQWLKLQINFLRKQGVNETKIQELINQTRELRQTRKQVRDELKEKWKEKIQNKTEEDETESCTDVLANVSMTLQEARQIALASECSGNCTADRCFKDTKVCNSNTGTWWLDLNIKRQGCAPACVVNVVNKTAEINWRCTGLVE